jgi:hypothetical protein
MANQPGKRVSVRRVIANVIRDMDIPDASRMFHSFVEWAFEAEKKIGSYKTFVRKTVTLNIVNQQASLPDDFLNLIDIKRAGDATGSTAFFEASSATFPNQIEKHSTYYLTENTINLSKGDISSINVSYLAVDTDDEGYPTISESHENAVAAYLMYKYKARDYWNGKLQRYIYTDLYTNWSKLCAQARGNDNMPSPSEMKKAAEIWNTLIPIKSTNGLLNV